MAQSTQIAFTTTLPGNFQVAHGLNTTPASVIIEMTAGGSVWFQPIKFDNTYVYLAASDAGLTGYLVIYATNAPFVPPKNLPGNSTIRLQEVVDDASSLGDVAPALATGGMSIAPALSIANDVMQTIVNGGNTGQAFNWKWNRYNIPPFATISLQQDYFIPGLSNLAWLEIAWAVNINQTSIPKQKVQVEVHKDLLTTYDQTAYVGKICWIPNSMAQTGTWGNAPLGPTVGNLQGQTDVFGINATGQQNPGPSVIYTNPIGVLITPQNATTAIADPYGNLWTLTTFGTCGATEPNWPQTVQYPTFKSPGTIATTIQDGTCVWTAIDPNGQALRLSPLPPITGIVWLVQAVGQMRAPRFTSLNQYLNPLPDDFEP